MSNERRQGIFWLLTIPSVDYAPPTELPAKLSFIRGQQELGVGGYLHWQIIAAFKKKAGLAAVKGLFGRTCHAELSRSASASEYVWKEDTRVTGTQFEYGAMPIARNAKPDWERIWQLAKERDLLGIPAHIRVLSYSSLKRIGADFSSPVGMERNAFVFWGPTGTGKSRRAWEEAGPNAYSKDPRTKFWCGYRGEEHVVVDEFRGSVDISHLLRWLDRYPCRVETKGSATPLQAHTYWFTSNLEPRLWYPDLDTLSWEALARRLTIINLT